ncbi:hypothetical protein BU24DRAFT_418075 [Aaosphaeria arxii CBS 175.79]|uniref:Ent-kaurene synthase n=1 Tax=Aaosphaeria arxii CBS 175.79 TaxID=1450172 RepID=A0A6A5XZD0_9PLEO|nr:uncharacterized protein BU24DRAFT_418075 [Aaosphaeria arxii CBS 175.79]KAF2018552.1 hypothetical protein BU24DRAFT_418075 [Aaosphaeria arxii CBS 175.79]
MESKLLKSRASDLLKRLSKATEAGGASAAYDSSLFDTALLASLYQKRTQSAVDGVPSKQIEDRLLIPESFNFLLSRQNPNGGWDSGVQHHKLGCILNVAAGLLAIVKRKSRTTARSHPSTEALEMRAQKAEEHLNHLLSTWSIQEAQHLQKSIQSLARILGRLRDEGVVIRLTGPQQDMSTSSITNRYHDVDETKKSTVGIDRSPAATILHLLDLETGHTEYENYLLEASAATGSSGCLPAEYPISQHTTRTVQELLLESGLMDARTLPSEPIFDSELDSLSASEGFDHDCRYLKSLIQRQTTPEIISAVQALTERVSQLWWNGSWNTTVCTSDYYAYLLFVQVFRKIVKSQEWKTQLSNDFLHIRGPITIVQMVTKILSEQNTDGTWGEGMYGCLETTSLALISLVSAMSLDFLGIIFMDIRHAVEKGRELLLFSLLSGKDTPGTKNALWIGQSASTSPLLREAYMVSAVAQTLEVKTSEDRTATLADKASRKALGLASFFHSLPALSNAPFLQLKAGAIESSFYVTMLKTMRTDIFPVTKAKEMDKYFDYIPIMWTMSSYSKGGYVPPVLIWDISVLSMYIFLADEYMEGYVANFTTTEFAELRAGIENIFALDHCPISPFAGNATPSARVQAALEVLGKWANYHLTYPSLAAASAVDTLNLRVESKNYLLHHITQLSDNQRLAVQAQGTASGPFRTPSMGFAHWLHVVGSGHIGAPIGLVWLSACVGSKIRGANKDCFRTVKQKMMIWNANSHAGKQLRMFNDYGSIARDAAERNLNSVDFPEFFSDGTQTQTQPCGIPIEKTSQGKGSNDVDSFEVTMRKQTLLDAAMYERMCTEREMDDLYLELAKDGLIGERLAKWVEVYYAGGDLFSDMYLVRDVTNSTKDR